MVATSFDSEETCYIKYPDAEEIVTKVRALGVPVLFEVDAGDLEAVELIRKMKDGFTKVVFNFPHVGQSSLFSAGSVFSMPTSLVTLLTLEIVLPSSPQGSERSRSLET